MRRVATIGVYGATLEQFLLGPVDLSPLVNELAAEGTSALLCVERDPEACHRSLIADRLAADYGCTIVHVR